MPSRRRCAATMSSRLATIGVTCSRAGGSRAGPAWTCRPTCTSTTYLSPAGGRLRAWAACRVLAILPASRSASM
eukprot:14194425-Alexandrium_andersonii.AAC.1